ncbi:MAG TPA: homoserine O-acetyltransferase [Gammaproteobacteria bacterium]|nr:homoserine O-acetyltransferase [Gammaproteobacteria bacterium]
MSARKTIRLPEPLTMYRGGTLDQVDIAYETWGELSAARDNAVLLFTGLSPSAHAASSPEDTEPGWWEEMIGSGKPLDTNRFHIICVNSLGSCFGSTGPASVNPATGKPWRLDFPMLSIEDTATAAWHVLQQLGIEKVAAVAGPSLGGMSALAYCLQYPQTAGALISISSTACALPFAIAVRSLQREMIRNDPDWQGGYYDKTPVQGMRLARKLGMLSYRSPQEWKERFGRQPSDISVDMPGPFDLEFAVEAYLEAHARKFIGNFDANCYLYLSHALDLFDAAEHGKGDLQQALQKLRGLQALVIGVETDLLFPIEHQQQLADELNAAGCKTQLARLPSLQGHDSFLIDFERFGPEIKKFMKRL